MAKMYQQKARKTYKCDKCGKDINPGDVYFKIEAPFRPTKYRCSCCRPERSELTESDYLQWLYRLQDHLNDDYDLKEESGKDELRDELENMKDELESRLENMPEQLQDSASGETLQNRIDSLDDAINELDCLEFPEEPNKEDYIKEVDVQENDESDGETEEAEIEDESEEENEEYESAMEDFRNELDSYLSSIEEIIGNIEE